MFQSRLRGKGVQIGWLGRSSGKISLHKSVTLVALCDIRELQGDIRLEDPQFPQALL